MRIKINNYSKVSVIGLGYIGLPTATCLATKGKYIVGVDINKDIVNSVNKGQIHIKEPGLAILVENVVRSGHLRATLKPEPSDAFLIAVPTPCKEGHKPDLSYIKSALDSIKLLLKKNDLIILESTSPVGTTEWLAEYLSHERTDLTFPQQCGNDSDIRIAYCPERVLPGYTMNELVQNDRLIGAMSTRCAEAVVELYKSFVKGQFIITNNRLAEMSKLTENAFRDVNIAFANELSIICDNLGINVFELIKLANHHPRVQILQPGPGVGGHCISVDPWFIINKNPDEAKLIKRARMTNDEKPYWVINKIESAFTTVKKKSLNNKPIIACLGLTFKPDIDDIRTSPAIIITEYLVNKLDCIVLAVDPNVATLPPNLVKENVMLTECVNAIKKADIVVLLVDHREFKCIDIDILKDKILIDTKGIFPSYTKVKEC